MSAYWDWWWGALALGVLTVAHHLVVGRRLGVSSAWERVAHWKREREVERLDAQFDESAWEAAMLEAADDLALARSGAGSALGGGSTPLESARVTATEAKERRPLDPAPRKVSVVGQAAFLAATIAGALAAAAISGRFEWRSDLGPAYSDVVTGGPLMWPILFLGGLLVGFGTRLAGGCSSGHGLSGCSRFQPVSLLATATFFGSAVVMSLLLWKVI